MPGVVPGIRDTGDSRVIVKEHNTKIKETEAIGVNSLSKNVYVCVPMYRPSEGDFKGLAHRMWRLGVEGRRAETLEELMLQPKPEAACGRTPSALEDVQLLLLALQLVGRGPPTRWRPPS